MWTAIIITLALLGALLLLVMQMTFDGADSPEIADVEFYEPLIEDYDVQ